MSLHVEWDMAETCGADAAVAEVANEDWALPEVVDAPAVLLLGGDGGGALAVEGTRAELIKFAQRVLLAAESLPVA